VLTTFITSSVVTATDTSDSSVEAKALNRERVMMQTICKQQE